ncbi:MAG: hypothetical protein ACK5Q5_05205 [Planctomycetaceae bacterium]
MSGLSLRSLFVVTAVAVWLHVAAPNQALAQESLLDSWLNMEQSEHAGLLGKRYVSGSYTYLSHGDSFLDQIDSSLEGYSINFNHPVLLPDYESWLGIDLFSSWSTIGLGGATHFQPGNIGLQFDSDTTASVYGGTIYGEPCCFPVRPLVQLGAVFSRNHSLILIDGFGGTFVDRDTSLLFRAGMEADITDWLALRTVFDINTHDSLSNSSFLADLIAWPTERIFFRGGLVAPLDGQGVGGHVGVGLTF